jgi:beta-glucanase (GH16 family)
MTTYYNYLGQPMPVSADPGSNGVHASGAGQTLTAPSGPSALYAYDTSGNSFNNDTFVGANGDNIFYVNNNSDLVQVSPGLTGIKTIVVWAGGYTLPANVQNLTFFGAGNWGAGNSLNNLIVMGGNDHATLDGGGGNDVLVGGLGGNDFQFEVNSGGVPGGHDVYYGFQPSLDTVRISGAGFTSFAQIQSDMQQVGSDVVLTIDANDSITFRSMTIAQFQPQSFLLPLDTSQVGAMTFDEEFNTLDLTKWNTTFGSDPTKLDDYAITSNTEKQLYTHPGMTGQDGWDLSAYNPFSISSGVLNITAGQFSYADSQHTWGQAYYSGMLNTRGLFQQQYGFFEMRAALPTDLGSWPAFWLSQDPYAPGAEADILEHLGMYPDVDFERAVGGGSVGGHTTYMPALSGFHNYGMLWTPTTTTFYIDELAVMSLPTPSSWTKPMYMILDMALGGWGGPIDASAFPATMQVDWVHVYGLASGSTTNPTHVFSDFNGDHLGDILWLNDSGALNVWTSQPGANASFSDHGLTVVPTAWSIAGQGDLNGDGKTDILWQNVNGGLSLWTSQSGSSITFAYQDLGMTPTGWHVQRVADFNDDGLDDILWRNDNGDLNIWTAQSGASATFGFHDLGVIGSDWSIAGVGDVNGDGKADILLRDVGGDVRIWTAGANLTFSQSDLGVVPTAWHVLGIGDVNGDGKADILWRNDNGDTQLWLPTATGAFSFADFGIQSSIWHFQNMVDVNGDGRADILWRNDNGDVSLWTSQAGSGVSFAYQDLGVVPTSWHIQSQWLG